MLAHQQWHGIPDAVASDSHTRSLAYHNLHLTTYVFQANSAYIPETNDHSAPVQTSHTHISRMDELPLPNAYLQHHSDESKTHLLRMQPQTLPLEIVH